MLKRVRHNSRPRVQGLLSPQHQLASTLINIYRLIIVLKNGPLPRDKLFNLLPARENSLGEKCARTSQPQLG